MFNPHIHQQQQQQQFQQHLRQLQQLFHQQPPPPQAPAVRHGPHPHQAHQAHQQHQAHQAHQAHQQHQAHQAHQQHQAHQAPRAIPVPPQSAPPPRMVNLCQTTQTTIIAPNPMLQGALLMQQMQGSMRGYRMGGQQFRQFFAAGARSSLLGPVPMGVAIKSPMMGFPPARPVYPHVRYYNNNSSVQGSSSSASSSTTEVVAHQSERKRDIEQVTQDLTEDQPGPSTATEANEGHVINPDDGCCTLSEELEEPVTKKQKTHGFEEIPEQPAECEILSSDNDSHPEEIGSVVGSEVLESENESTAADAQGSLTPAGNKCVDMPMVEAPQEDSLLPLENQEEEEEEEDVDEGTNKFYCYLCSITCHNQQNFRSHMNSISHQQRMMEIQHMSNACLVTLLPRLQDTLQGSTKDGEKKKGLKRWCVTCQTHFTCSVINHRQTKEHKLARKMAISSCTICKKHFKSSQIFIQHLQTSEHRKKVEMVQENECSEEQTKIPDGFLVEEEGGVSGDDEDVQLSNAEDPEDLNKQDGGASEVTLEDMDDSVQYDPEVLYGGRFFVPVAGFICKLCNKFYHFESSDLHLHCKSLEHFENLKRYKTDQNCEASRKCVADEANTGSSQSTTELSPKQPFVSVCRLVVEDNKTEEPNEAVQDVTISTPSASDADREHPAVDEAATEYTTVEEAATEHTTVEEAATEHTTVEEAATSLTVADQDSSETVTAVTRDSVSNEGNEEEPKVNEKKTLKATPRRRTGRTTNRR